MNDNNLHTVNRTALPSYTQSFFACIFFSILFAVGMFLEYFDLTKTTENTNAIALYLLVLTGGILAFELMETGIVSFREKKKKHISRIACAFAMLIPLLIHITAFNGFLLFLSAQKYVDFSRFWLIQMQFIVYLIPLAVVWLFILWLIYRVFMRINKKQTTQKAFTGKLVFIFVALIAAIWLLAYGTQYLWYLTYGYYKEHMALSFFTQCNAGMLAALILLVGAAFKRACKKNMPVKEAEGDLS